MGWGRNSDGGWQSGQGQHGAKRGMNGANKDDYNNKGENQRQTWQEEVNKGGEVTAGRVRKVNKCDWTVKKVLGVVQGRNWWEMRTAEPRDIGKRHG